MSTWNAIYVRGALPAGFQPEVEGTCAARPVSNWTELALPALADGETTALALSKLVSGQVVWAVVQTTASVVSVMHCERGEVLRRIAFADGSWRCAEGQPQPWESWLFSHDELEAAKDDCDPEDEAELEAAFARRTLNAGDELPRPREWETFFHALGVSRSDWEAAQAAPPTASFEGSKTSKLTVFTRGAGLAGAACVVGAVLASEGARGGLAGLATPLLLLALGAGFVRRRAVGRWFL